MGSNVFANGMGIAHKGSGDKSIVGPDVCKTSTPEGKNVCRHGDLMTHNDKNTMG